MKLILLISLLVAFGECSTQFECNEHNTKNTYSSLDGQTEKILHISGPLLLELVFECTVKIPPLLTYTLYVDKEENLAVLTKIDSANNTVYFNTIYTPEEDKSKTEEQKILTFKIESDNLDCVASNCKIPYEWIPHVQSPKQLDLAFSEMLINMFTVNNSETFVTMCFMLVLVSQIAVFILTSVFKSSF